LRAEFATQRTRKFFRHQPLAHEEEVTAIHERVAQQQHHPHRRIHFFVLAAPSTRLRAITSRRCQTRVDAVPVLGTGACRRMGIIPCEGWTKVSPPGRFLGWDDFQGALQCGQPVFKRDSECAVVLDLEIGRGQEFARPLLAERSGAQCLCRSATTTSAKRAAAPSGFRHVACPAPYARMMMILFADASRPAAGEDNRP